ncbi:hypothetical protein LQG66_28955 [Bradyrhizobium ontarionense]|uniref:Uncharacterized protein n=1 Tax=Bradyrhizobium ontarionense TaxID=2898149 RepID=A0ABY3R8V3_9BRAD|nr:hypothetical protein [Bradyrhizobium sp. A19]UFZ03236.1 hypothetical protein LQG66_28955 [Bradyrhizobium sp. A19]
MSIAQLALWRKRIAAPMRALIGLLTCAMLLAWPARAPAAEAGGGAAVEIRNGPTPSELELRAHGTVELASELIVEEQRADGTFARAQDLDRDSLRLVASCDRRPGTCVTIDERGLRPVPWSGMSCSSQCGRDCDRNFPMYGRFRFVVMSCDGGTRFEGPVFERPRPHRFISPPPASRE